MASMLRVQLHFLQEGGIPLPKALLTAKGTAEQAVVPSETEWSSILLERNNTKKKKKRLPFIEHFPWTKHCIILLNTHLKIMSIA